MKKNANATINNTFCQENNQNFLAIVYHFLISKSDFTALCSRIAFLFQEKLPIIYANIRV
jgi:hypothetical protein